MKRLVPVALILGLVAVLASASLASAQETATVRLAEQNGSGVSGTARLTDLGSGKTRVEVQVAANGNADMPAHIHEGACPQPGGVKYPLANVKDGASTTEVNASLKDLMASPLAINMHKSAQEISVYTACGNLASFTAAAQPVAAQPASAGGPAVLAVAGALAAAGAGLVGIGAALRRRRS